MKKYSKEDPEYRGNGHYVIDGVEFMSIWTYKRFKNLSGNTTSQNGDEAIKLSNLGIKAIATTPDIGNFDKIYVYPTSDLNNFYNN